MIKVSFNDGSWWVFKDQNLANAVIEAKRDKLVGSRGGVGASVFLFFYVKPSPSPH